jgi:endonuclease YncB( thermonuclease family)
MKKFPALTMVACLLLSFIADADGFKPGAELQGEVVGVSDGDTLSLLIAGNQNIRVRLAEIDAPEKSQAFGQVSRKSLSDLIYGQRITVRVNDTDKYGRTVGRAFIDGHDVNLIQVQKGLAWAYERYLTDPMFPSAEKQARARKLGLWSDPTPTPPWLFRRGDTSVNKSSLKRIKRAVADRHLGIDAMLIAWNAQRG